MSALHRYKISPIGPIVVADINMLKNSDTILTNLNSFDHWWNLSTKVQDWNNLFIYYSFTLLFTNFIARLLVIATFLNENKDENEIRL